MCVVCVYVCSEICSLLRKLLEKMREEMKLKQYEMKACTLTVCHVVHSYSHRVLHISECEAKRARYVKERSFQKKTELNLTKRNVKTKRNALISPGRPTATTKCCRLFLLVVLS